jgi:POT family proton-dependent oligopeptide transporter
MFGGLFFMAGHLLLAFPSLTAVYAALTCLVIGNGFFKPNVSTMVGNLYPEGSKLKDSAYNIFYMGINIGAFVAPIVAEIVQGRFGFHPAFAVAAGGMVVSIAILWQFRSYVEPGARSDLPAPHDALQPAREAAAESAAVAQNVPPAGLTRSNPIDAVPVPHRLGGLLVVFLIVIVFWMAFSQNGSTITYWADENTDWSVSGIISNSINPFWIIALTYPLVLFWNFLRARDLEPSTPMKMVLGMFLTGLAFFVLYLAALEGEKAAPPGQPYAFRVSPWWLVSFYAIISLGELMLSPMGLSLVSKVAPPRLRGLMMGGWFVATAIGNKLTVIGVYWTEWKHSTFFAIVGALALGTGVLLLVLLRPLKKVMPGV